MDKDPSQSDQMRTGGEESEATSTGQGSGNAVRKKKMVKRGVAVGIGSAAIVAALLYANRGKRG